jgi:hypothetical protein
MFFLTRPQTPQRALGGLKEVADATCFNTCRRVLTVPTMQAPKPVSEDHPGPRTQVQPRRKV